MIGTTDWRLVETTFDVPANAGLLDVHVARKASLKFDNQIRGTVWIDDVKISPVQ